MRPLVLKSVLFGSFILFGLIVTMTVFGGIACMCGAGDTFFCGAFCSTGKIGLALAALIIATYVIRALRN